MGWVCELASWIISIDGQNSKKNLSCQRTLRVLIPQGVTCSRLRDSRAHYLRAWNRLPRESQVVRRLCKISRLFYIYSENDRIGHYRSTVLSSSAMSSCFPDSHFQERGIFRDIREFWATYVNREVDFLHTWAGRLRRQLGDGRLLRSLNP